MGSVLVIGYGNELRGDDGAGFRAAQQLTDDPRLEAAAARVLARRQLTPELALDVSRAAALVLVDASTLLAPGEVSVRPLQVADGRSSSWSHHMMPETLLALAAELYGAAPAAYVVSIGVAQLEMDEQLSPAAEAALPRAADEVARLVAEHARA